MANQVKIYLRAQDDEAIVEPLIDFFEPVASASIEKPELVVKSLEPIELILTVAGATGLASWAAGRFILDPLADRVEEWWQGVTFLWKRSRARHKIGITVNFEFPTNRFQVSLDETADENMLKPVWQDVNRAYEIYQNARNQGIQLDRIRVLPDGTPNALVIAYQDNRPKYTVDLKSGKLKEIESTVSSDETVTSTDELWMLKIAIQRHDYLKMLSENGHRVSMNEVQELEREIESRKRNLLT